MNDEIMLINPEYFVSKEAKLQYLQKAVRLRRRFLSQTDLLDSGQFNQSYLSLLENFKIPNPSAATVKTYAMLVQEKLDDIAEWWHLYEQEKAKEKEANGE